MTQIVGIIPARFGSTRFPGKPLLKIGNWSMIRWTYENTKKSNLLTEVYVATDDERIEKEVLSFGGKVLMTSPEHASGTDRLIEATEKISSKAEIIVNIQGDEPGIDTELIDGVIKIKLENRNWEMSTAAVLIEDKNELNDPNRVKVVFNQKQKALYFSRSLIPSLFKKDVNVYRHLGIYTYEREFLLKYNSLPVSELEASESLEQLRAIDYGASIGVFIARKAGLSIDVPEDLEKVEKEFKEKNWI